MATFYASTSGSNTAPYDTWAKAANDPQDAINSMAADGDDVVLDDEPWVFSTPLNTNSFISTPPINANLRIKSRSDNPALSSLSSDQADKSIIDFNQAVRILNITLDGFKLTKSVTHTDINTPAIASVSGQAGSITFRNCPVQDIDVVYGVQPVGNGPVIRCAGAARTVYFIGSPFSGIDVQANAGGTNSGLISSGANCDLSFDFCEFDLCTFSQSGAGSIFVGAVYARNNLTVSHNITSNITSTKQVGSTGSHRPFFYSESTTDMLSVNGSIVSNLTWTNGAISGVFLMSKGPYAVTGLNVDSCTGFEPTVNNLGCAFYSFGDFSQGTYSDSIVTNCTATHGPAFYAGQGGGGVLTNITAHDNTAEGRVGVPSGGGAIYCGGWGDVTIDYCLLYNNTADEGGGIYAHIHGTLSTRAKTTTIRNCTIVGNIATQDKGGSGGNGAVLRGNNATYSHTVDFINCISSNGGVDELLGEEIGGTLVFTVDHSDIIGGPGSVVGADVYTNNIALDPLFLNEPSDNYRLQSNSPCRKSGVDVGLTNDLDGLPFNQPPSMGAYDFGTSIGGRVDTFTRVNIFDRENVFDRTVM